MGQGRGFGGKWQGKMNIRHLGWALAIGAALYASAPLQAQSETTGCVDAHLAVTRSLVLAEGKYGTIYSGGVHFSGLNNISGTLDFYRKLGGFGIARGRADNYQTYRGRSGLNYYDFVSQDAALLEAQLKTALSTMGDAPLGQMVDANAAATVLDLTTSLTPALDWWLRAEEFEVRRDEDLLNNFSNRYYSRDKSKLSTLQQVNARLSKTHPELDWLNAAMVISTVPYPWAIQAGDTPSQELANVLEHISQKALTAENPIPWMALLELNIAYDYALPDELRAKLKMTAAKGCKAGYAEYGAMLASKVEMPADRLMGAGKSRQFTHVLSRHLLKKETRLDANFYNMAMAMSEELDVQPAQFRPIILAASTPDQLARVMEKTPPHHYQHYKILSRLKTEHLEPYSSGAAFTRYLSLGEYDRARVILDAQVAQNAPLSAELEDILSADLSDPLALSLVTLRQKCLSHQLSQFCVMENYKGHRHRDLTLSISPANFIADAMYCRGKPKVRYSGHGRSASAAADRYRRRGLPNTSQAVLSYYRASCYVPVLSPALSEHAISNEPPALAVMFDEAELEQFRGEGRLTRTLSVNVINAVTQKHKKRFWPSFGGGDGAEAEHELLAEALHRVVLMNKHEDGGDIDGMPAGRRAFELLHHHYPESEWATKTPYWWPPRRRG